MVLTSSKTLKCSSTGCSVVVGRGFNIIEDLKMLGVKLVIPCFKGRGRSQMTRMEFESSERVAEVRNNCRFYY